MVLAILGKSYPMLVFTIGFENLAGGMGTAAFVAFLMALCNHNFTATQFALLSAMASLGRVFVGPTSGFIVDEFGETKKFHKIGSSVFLGGSIIKRGGQNPLEAARYGARILHGPNTDNFKDIYKLLKSFKISKKITNSEDMASSIIFKKNKNTAVKINNIGEIIFKKTIKELDNLINNEFKKT